MREQFPKSALEARKLLWPVLKKEGTEGGGGGGGGGGDDRTVFIRGKLYINVGRATLQTVSRQATPTTHHVTEHAQPSS